MNKKTLIGLGIVAVVIVLAIGAYLYAQTSSTVPVPEGWSVYSHKGGMFSLAYPDNYSIEMESKSDTYFKAKEAGERTGGIIIRTETTEFCHYGFCTIEPVTQQTIRNVTWDNLGTPTYCDVGECYSAKKTFRASKDGTRFYVELYGTSEQLADEVLAHLRLK